MKEIKKALPKCKMCQDTGVAGYIEMSDIPTGFVIKIGEEKKNIKLKKGKCPDGCEIKN